MAASDDVTNPILKRAIDTRKAPLECHFRRSFHALSPAFTRGLTSVLLRDQIEAQMQTWLGFGDQIFDALLLSGSAFGGHQIEPVAPTDARYGSLTGQGWLRR